MQVQSILGEEATCLCGRGYCEVHGTFHLSTREERRLAEVQEALAAERERFAREWRAVNGVRKRIARAADARPKDWKTPQK